MRPRRSRRHKSIGNQNLLASITYDPASVTDGTRLLVERLWPRGLPKERLKLDGWIREVAPTTELRKWFGHDAAKWPQFRARYFRELDSRAESWRSIVSSARRGTVTLVYSSHDQSITAPLRSARICS